MITAAQHVVHIAVRHVHFGLGSFFLRLLFGVLADVVVVLLRVFAHVGFFVSQLVLSLLHKPFHVLEGLLFLR